MLASRIDRFGEPAEAVVSEVELAEPAPGDVRVKVEAAAINPSDLANIGGRFPQTTLPRIVGRDFAGTVVAGPAEDIGAKVWGTGGDLGFTRDGTHAEFDIPRAAIALRPPNLPADVAAAIGVPFVTAWSATIELGQLAPGEWILVSGAAGAVGSAAIEIAASRSARAIALVKVAAEAERVDAQRVAAVVHAGMDDLAGVVRRASGDGCNLALNGVGAPVFTALFASLAKHGRLVVYSAAAGREATLDLFALYRQSITLFGLDTAALDAVRCARILDRLAPLFESGTIRPPSIDRRYALAEASRAYAYAEEHAGSKVILVPE